MSSTKSYGNDKLAVTLSYGWNGTFDAAELHSYITFRVSGQNVESFDEFYYYHGV